MEGRHQATRFMLSPYTWSHFRERAKWGSGNVLMNLFCVYYAEGPWVHIRNSLEGAQEFSTTLPTLNEYTTQNFHFPEGRGQKN